jgi:hypothetical protein
VTAQDFPGIASQLPDGWKVEGWGAIDGMAIISCSQGSVTVDLDRRSYRLGVVTTGHPYMAHQYKGRKWRERLADDAVAALRAAIGSRLDRTSAGAP